MQVGNTEQFSNHHLSSDWSLQPETMKPESLVIVDQHATVNLYLSLVHTARHTMKVNRIQRNCSFFYLYHSSIYLCDVVLKRCFYNSVYDCSEVVTR